MTIIHLKRYYKHHTEDITLDVPDEIAATLSLGGRTCESYLRKKWYHHEYSLDCNDGIENDVTCRPNRYGEMSLFSGLLYCADCGHLLYCQRYKGQNGRSRCTPRRTNSGLSGN